MRLAALTVAALVGSTVAPIASAQPGMTPVAAPPPTTSVADRPTSIGLDFGWHALGVQDDSYTEGEGASTTFRTLAMSVRYRFARTVQVGVVLVAGRGSEYELRAGGLYVDVRYRFLAERRVSPYALLALGVMSVAAEGDATNTQKQGRGAFRLGGGVEHRWARWGAHAELVLATVGENPDARPGPDHYQWLFARSALAGVGLSIGGSFYF